MTYLAPIANRPKYRPIAQADFGGLMTLDAPDIPRRGALASENMDYSNRRIRKAMGDRAVLENAVGARQIENFESAVNWTGGVVETGADNYIAVEAEAAGIQSRVLSQIGVGSATMERTYSPPLVLGVPSGDGFDGGFDDGFGSDPSLVERPLDVFHIWRKPLVLSDGITGYQIRLIFETSTGNYFSAVLAGTGTDEERLENDLAGEFTDEFTTEFNALGIGLYTRIRRYRFAPTGSPSWASISKVRIELEITTGTDTLTVAFDNLYWSPGYVQDLFQFRRFSSPLRRAREEYAVAGGKLFRSDGLRWKEVYQGFDPERPVNHLVTDDRCFLTDGKTTPIKIMADGSIYRMGIVPPPKQVALARITGGQLADQDVFVAVKFFSTKTGIESAPDEKTPGTKLTIAGGGGTAGVRVSSIPVSLDPQVTHVRLFIRPANLSDDQFFRSSGDPDGEVTNGTTTFDILNSVTQLENFEVMDPDTDYPTVVVDGEQVEGHPIFFAETGGYVMAAFAQAPGTLRASQRGNPEYWPLDSEVELGFDDDDEITGIASGVDVAFAFKRDAVYPVRAVGGSVGLVAGESISERGSMNHKGIVRIGGMTWYPNEDGVYWITGSLRPLKASAQAQPTWDGLWDPQQREKMVGVELRPRFQYHLFGSSLGQIMNNRDWVTHYPRQEAAYRRAPDYDASIHTYGADAATVLEDSADLRRTWIAREGVVFQIDTGVSRDGRGFDSIHLTGIWTPDDAGGWVCRWPWIDVLARVSGDTNLGVNAFMGPALVSDASLSASLKGQSAPLGQFILGTSKLGAAAYTWKRLNLPRIRSRYLQMAFTHSGRGEVEVINIKPYYLPISQRGSA